MTYLLDSSGADPANLIANEPHGIKGGQTLYLDQPLFYSKGFSATYTGADGQTTALIAGVDYAFIYELDGVIDRNPIYAAVVIINNALNGQAQFTYQTVGGNWIFNAGQAERYLKRNVYSPRMAYVAIVPYPAVTLAGDTSPLQLTSFASLQRAQAAYPNGLSLGVEIQELPENQKLISAGSGIVLDGAGNQVKTEVTSTGGTSTGGTGTDTSGLTNVAEETGGNLDAIKTNTSVMSSKLATISSQLPSARGPQTSALSLSVTPASDAVMHVVVDNAQDIGGGGGAVTGSVTANIGTTGGLALDATLATVKTSIDSQTTALSGSQGTTADAAYTGAGNSTIISLLKGLYAAIKGTLAIRALSSGTDSVTVQGGNTTAVKVDGSAVTQPVSVAALPLPSGAATDATLQSILSAIQATKDLAETIWFDSTVATPVYYVRRVTINEGTGVATVSWQNIDGTAASPTVANLKSVANAQNINSQSAQYLATSAGTGYSSGDTLFHVYGVDTSTATASIAYSFWLNASTGATLSVAPTNGTYSASSSSTVSVSSSVLPANAAQETGGNLAALASTQGTAADTAYTGAGSSTIVAALKGIYAKIAGVLNIRALSSGTDSVTATINGTPAVTVGNTVATSNAQLPVALGAQASAGSVSITPATDAVMHVTVDNYAQIGGGGGTVDTSTLAKDATLTSVLNAIKAQQALSDTIWFDGTVNPPVYYVRRESVDEGTGTYSVTWENPDGTAASPTVANLSAIANARNINNQATQYIATSGGTGYSANDILFHAYGIDTSMSTPTIAYNFWLNASTGATLAGAPTNGTYSASSSSTVSVSSSALPANAAQETGGNLAAVAAAQGTTADGAYAGTGNSSVIGLLKGLYARLAGTQTVAGTVTANVQGGNTTAVKVDGSAVTQPVSVASLPLPSGAAQESGGNLAAISAAQGTTADVAYNGTGNSSVISTLKGIYAAVKGTLAIRALSSGTDSVTVQGGNATAVKVDGSAVTQPVSVASLPLPTGAALDTSIQTLINTVKATQGLSVTIWFDNTVNPPVYYVRRETVNEGAGTFTIAWEDASGNAATPTVANLVAVSNSRNINAQTAQYAATGTGTGYVSGDILFHAYGIDTSLSTPAVVYNFWLNATQGATLSAAPTNGTYSASSASSVSVTSSALPTNAAQETGGNLASAATALGSPTDAAYSGGSSASAISALKSNYVQLLAVKNALNNSTSIADSVWVDNTGSTYLYYLRRASYNTQNGAAVGWFNLDGTAASPTLANLKPANAVSEVITDTATYTAAQAGTGYSVGDMLIHTYGLNVGTNPVTIAYSVWLNGTTNAVLSAAPTSAALQATAASSVSVSSSALPTGAATDATLQAISALQQQIENVGEVIADAMVAVLNKFPRSTSSAQQVVYLEASAGASVNNVISGFGTATDGNVLLANGIPMGISDAGSVRNYNQLGFDGQ